MSSFFTNDFMGEGGYDSSLKQSAQGQLSSEYTAALTAELQTEAVADYIAFLVFQGGADVETALAVKQAIIDGQFTLSDLFGAAQSKTGEVDGLIITDPEPKLTLTGVEFAELEAIDLSGFLTGLDTETWKTSNKSGDIFHTREFYTATDIPEYDTDWADSNPVNQAPTADPIVLELTEYDEKAAAKVGPDNTEVNLLTAANAADPEGDALSIVDGSVKLANGDPLPDYITYADGVLTIDKNHPSLDDLYKDDIWNVEIKYEITDGTNTISNTVDLELTGTADQFSSTGGSWSDSDTFTTPGQDGTLNIVLTGAHEDAFDFTGVVNVSVNGDYQAANETIVTTSEPVTNFVTLGGLGLSQAEGADNFVSDSDTVAFASADNTVTLTYDNSSTVNGGSITATVINYEYWL